MAEKYDFVTTDTQSIYNSVLDNIMDEVNEPLYPGDERRIFAEALIMVLVAVYNDLNDAAQQRTLRHARGYVLDAIGEMRNTERLEPSAANDIFRFSVSAAQPNNIIIPAGTRITPDGSVYFATEAAAVLQAGNLYVDVKAVCMAAGEEYNGLGVGKVNVLVDLIPYISTVTNLNGTSGGDNGEPYPWEDDGTGDNRYRERIKLAPSTYSVAGPEAAYKYFALSASPNIIDVEIDSPGANKIDIYALMENGEIPTEKDLETIQAAFPDDVRPMTDIVTVKAPSQVEYGIEIKYYCTLDNETQAVQTVEADGGAVDLFNEWQTAALGRDINPDHLRKLILAPADGTAAVDRVEVKSPTFQSLTKKQVAKFNGTITISHEVMA